MKCIVNPQYRWLNSLLVAAYGLVTLSQIVQAIIDTNTVLHFLLAALFGFLAFSIYRVASWAYLAAGLLNLFGVLGMLNNAASLTGLGFVALLISGATAGCAFFLRGQLLVPVSNENS